MGSHSLDQTPVDVSRLANNLGAGKPTVVVGVAASAGGLAALTVVLSQLRSDFPAPVVVVQHLSPSFVSTMAEILSRRAVLRVKQAEEGERLAPSTVYIAPPDRHLLCNADGTLSLSSSGQVNYVRPSADRLFDSLARVYGKGAIAVVLTGTGRDGSDGVRAVHRLGGTVIVQDGRSAEFSGMPDAAVATRSVDLILALEDIPRTLTSLVWSKQK